MVTLTGWVYEMIAAHKNLFRGGGLSGCDFFRIKIHLQFYHEIKSK